MWVGLPSVALLPVRPNASVTRYSPDVSCGRSVTTWSQPTEPPRALTTRCPGTVPDQTSSTVKSTGRLMRFGVRTTAAGRRPSEARPGSATNRLTPDRQGGRRLSKLNRIALGEQSILCQLNFSIELAGRQIRIFIPRSAEKIPFFNRAPMGHDDCDQIHL
jgi:hypothetical protein